MINKLYISTANYNWNDSTSTLVDLYNLNKIIDKQELIDCHTSVSDLFCENISLACVNANNIILVDIDENTEFTLDHCFSYGRLFNELEKHKDKVTNFTWNKDFNYLKNKRTDNDPVLWTAGCSITEGIGVTHKDRWGTLLAKNLNLVEVTLAQGQTSIYWSADQLLRSDIRKNDIVVWGLTQIARSQISKNWNFKPISPTNYDSIKKDKHQELTLDYLESETNALLSVRSILQVINFCQKIGATLYLANMLDITWVKVALARLENFVDLTEDLKINGTTLEFIDLGSDNSHPGPEQHRQYAEKLYNLIKGK